VTTISTSTENQLEAQGASLALFDALILAGNTYAMTKYARMLLKGWLVDKDEAFAVLLLQHAAACRWRPAERLLASFYVSGAHGCPKDLEKARSYFDDKTGANAEFLRRYRGDRSVGAKVIQFPANRRLTKLPEGHGWVLW
jgi:TPR repeat protein